MKKASANDGDEQTCNRTFNPNTTVPVDGLELEFSKPRGYVVISRQPFPVADTEVAWNQCIDRNWGGCSDTERGQYISFGVTLRQSMATFVKTKLTAHFINEIRKSDLGSGSPSRKVVTISGVWHRFLKEDFTKEDCREFFNIYYGSITDELFCHLQYANMVRHELWFSTDRNHLNFQEGMSRLCKSSVWHMMKNTLRDSFRNKLSKQGLNAHGVKISVSVPKGTLKEERQRNKKPKEFRFEFNVKGWDEPKHLEFKKKLRDDAERKCPAGAVGTMVPTVLGPAMPTVPRPSAVAAIPPRPGFRAPAAASMVKLTLHCTPTLPSSF